MPFPSSGGAAERRSARMMSTARSNRTSGKAWLPLMNLGKSFVLMPRRSASASSPPTISAAARSSLSVVALTDCPGPDKRPAPLAKAGPPDSPARRRDPRPTAACGTAAWLRRGSGRGTGSLPPKRQTGTLGFRRFAGAPAARAAGPSAWAGSPGCAGRPEAPR